jgi:hypothetical protein
MATQVFNRADFKHPTDGFYQIEAKGEHPNARAGVVQVIDDKSAESIVNCFNAAADAGTLRHGNEMLIDHEHFKDDPDKETVAYGWLQRMENRDDGIYGKIRWTNTGQPAVDGGDYRFFSTEYAPDDLEQVTQQAGSSGLPKVRPLRLDGLTLTNMNNNRGQKPITNRNMGSADAAPISESDRPRIQQYAARLFVKLVDADQRATGFPASMACHRVANREPEIHALAKGDFSHTLPGRIANRQPEWDALADLEPAAKKYYLDAIQKSGHDEAPKDALGSTRRDFLYAMRDMISLFPELGAEARFAKAKEIIPGKYWGFVKTFDPDDQEILAHQAKLKESGGKMANRQPARWQSRYPDITGTNS